MKKIIIYILIFTSIVLFYSLFKNNNITDNLNNSNIPLNNFIKIETDGEVQEIQKFNVPIGTSIKKLIPFIHFTFLSVIKDENEIFLKDTILTIYKREKDYININTANKQELIQIPNIGDAKAMNIIEYRKNKKIESYDELNNIIKLSNEKLFQVKLKTIII